MYVARGVPAHVSSGRAAFGPAHLQLGARAGLLCSVRPHLCGCVLNHSSLQEEVGVWGILNIPIRMGLCARDSCNRSFLAKKDVNLSAILWDWLDVL